MPMLERPDGEHRPSIIRDLSESGALLLVRTTKIAVGDEVKLQLYIADDPGTFREATARVVRVEDLVVPQVLRLMLPGVSHGAHPTAAPSRFGPAPASASPLPRSVPLLIGTVRDRTYARRRSRR